MDGPGRPSLYKPEFAAQAFELCLAGATNQDLADSFEVGHSTIDNWLQKHPEFAQSVKRGRDLADGRVAHGLYSRAIGYTYETTRVVLHRGELISVPHTVHKPPDVRACTFWLRNRCPQQWREGPKPMQDEGPDWSALDEASERARLADQAEAAGSTAVESASSWRPDRREIGHDQPHDLVFEGGAPEERLLLHDGVADRGHQGARQHEHLLGREGCDQRPRAGACPGARCGDEGDDRVHHLDAQSLRQDRLRHGLARAVAAAEGIDHRLHYGAHAALDLKRPSDTGQADRHLLAGERQQDRVLVGEVLVERADADARPFGHGVGGKGRQSTDLENLSRGLQNQRHGLPGARLAGDSSFYFNGLLALDHIGAVLAKASTKPE
jgi:hypothetical protein